MADDASDPQSEVDGTDTIKTSALSDLGTRLAFGVLLAAVALGLLWAGSIPFAVLVFCVTLIMSWEWAKVVRSNTSDATFFIHVAAITAAIALSSIGYAALGAAAVVVGAILVALLQFGRHPVLSALGVFYTGIPAIALLWLRSQESYGFEAVLFLFAIVWATDIAAYFGGRLLGGPKLAQRISPKKTWSGFVVGLAAAASTAYLFAGWIGAPVWPLTIVAFALSLLGQFGDLAESALKRRFGTKDTSNLIPGHGGFLDRLDSVVPVVVAAAVFAFFTGPGAPAKALLWPFAAG
jgi:phosphatidate cytidylyltransferase